MKYMNRYSPNRGLMAAWYMASMNLVSNGSDNGLLPAGAKPLREPMQTYVKTNLKMFYAKWLPYCLGLDAISRVEHPSHSGWHAGIWTTHDL